MFSTGGTWFYLPLFTTVETQEFSVFHLIMSSLNTYFASFDQRLGNFSPGRVQQPLERWPGQPHQCSAFSLFLAFQIF